MSLVVLAVTWNTIMGCEVCEYVCFRETVCVCTGGVTSLY